MPDIFLSFASRRSEWKKKFIEVGQFGRRSRILDYENRPLVSGELGEALDDRIEGCDGFIALVDEVYTKSPACLAEFDFAVDQFGINSSRFGAVVLDSPGRDFVAAKFNAALSERVYVDLAAAGGDGPRGLDKETDVQTVLRFADALVNAVAAGKGAGGGPHSSQPRPPRVIVLGVPVGASSDGIAAQRKQLLDGLNAGGIAAFHWDDDWTTSAPPDQVKKALDAEHPPMFVLPIDKSLAVYYSKTTLQGFVRQALGGLVAGAQRQMPKCVVWCPSDPPPAFAANAGMTVDADDSLRSDPQARLIEWLRTELGLATWKTAVISLEGFKSGKSGEKSAANQIGRHLKNILLPAVRDICRPPEPLVTNLYSFDSPRANLEAEFARQLKQYAGSGVAIVTIHDLSLGMAPDWMTAYNDLKQKISRYQKLINKITVQSVVDQSRIVKIAIVMSNREYKVGSEIFADDDLVGWKIIGMSLMEDGTMDIAADDTAMFTEAVCSVVNAL